MSTSMCPGSQGSKTSPKSGQHLKHGRVWSQSPKSAEVGQHSTVCRGKYRFCAGARRREVPGPSWRRPARQSARAEQFIAPSNKFVAAAGPIGLLQRDIA